MQRRAVYSLAKEIVKFLDEEIASRKSVLSVGVRDISDSVKMTNDFDCIDDKVSVHFINDFRVRWSQPTEQCYACANTYALYGEYAEHRL